MTLEFEVNIGQEVYIFASHKHPDVFLKYDEVQGKQRTGLRTEPSPANVGQEEEETLAKRRRRGNW